MSSHRLISPSRHFGSWSKERLHSLPPRAVTKIAASRRGPVKCIFLATLKLAAMLKGTKVQNQASAGVRKF
jgi:hypothetical protein